jgi:hypothetical protein
MSRDPLPGREVIFEYRTVGAFLRIAAVDVATGEEVVVSGPVRTSQHDLERIALRKLARRLGLSLTDVQRQTPRPNGRGVVV